mgnify:CR=1 FL=1
MNPLPSQQQDAGRDQHQGRRRALRDPRRRLGQTRLVLQIGRQGLIKVPVSYGTSTFDLAMDERHYTALRAWVEAVPPGWNSSF